MASPKRKFRPPFSDYISAVLARSPVCRVLGEMTGAKKKRRRRRRG